MNKPRYTHCEELDCRTGSVECWRKNHIPYVGILLSRYQRHYTVFEVVFGRYVRMKGVVWPDEAVAFIKGFAQKHPEISLVGVRFDMGLGAYFHKGRVYRLFGRGGVLAGDPCTPKKNRRDSVFITRAARQLAEESAGERCGAFDGVLFTIQNKQER